MKETEIEVEKDFVVTYNCHNDEYTVEGSVAGSKKVVEGWKTYADHTHMTRRMVMWNESEEKETWALRRSDGNDIDEPKTIRWTFKVPHGKSSGIYVFVNSDSRDGEVTWNLTVPKKQLTSQLNPRVINIVQWEERFDDFSGMGILSR